MAKLFESIEPSLGDFLESQPIFFVATSPLSANGLVNCSPKGNRDEFVVLSPSRVAYLDQTGSGVETIAHLRENGRIVIMFCAFAGPPRIVRLHGRGRHVERGDPEFVSLGSPFARSGDIGVRSIVVVDVERVSDSCGFGVPFMNFDSHRPTMDQWAERKGPDGVAEYHATRNLHSIDGLEGMSGPREML